MEQGRNEFACNRLVGGKGRTLHVLHFGGFVGYSVACQYFDIYVVRVCLPSGNMTLNLNSPPSQIVFALPGIEQFQFFSSMTPCALRSGRATKPKG